MRFERINGRMVVIQDENAAKPLCPDCYALVDPVSGQVLEVKHCERCIKRFKEASREG